MSEWQPIETAPKDGRQFLAYAKGQMIPRHFIAVAQWASADPDFPQSVDGWFWPYAIRPTHWKPLPEPPK